MHILIIPSWYRIKEYPLSGLFVQTQAKALSKVGNQVTILHVELRRLRDFKLSKLRENHGQISDSRVDGVHEFILKSWNPLSQTNGGEKILLLLYRYLFNQYIKKYGIPDIVHAHSSFMAAIFANWIWNQYRIPYFVTEHSTFLNLQKQQQQILQKVANDSCRFFAVSSSLANNLKNVYEMKNVDVLHNFVDTSFFYKNQDLENIQREKFVFFSSGSFNYNKGFDILLTAFANAFKGNLKVILRIAGLGELENEIKNHVQLLGLEKQVAVVGMLNQEQIKAELFNSDAYVLASRRETFGVVFTEAMSAGLPVIATKCGGPEDFVTPETGYLISTESVEELTTALLGMYKNRASFNSEKIQKYVYDNFDCEVLAQKLSEIYKQNLR